MSDLKYPETSDEWAWQKGIKRKCRHGWYDPNIGCPKCKQEEFERRIKEEAKRRRLKEAFDILNRSLGNEEITKKE